MSERFVKSLIKRSRLLKQMEISAKKNRYVPICGPIKGKTLFMLAKSMKAKKILELGTAIGYSTIWLADALDSGGKIITVDRNDEWVKEARENVIKAGVENKVKFVNADVRKILKKMKSQFDYIFLDVEKQDYIKVLKDCIRLLKKGGILVADNALWEELREFCQVVSRHPQLETLVLPVVDGMSVSIKK